MGRLITRNEGWEAFQRELRRSRRYEHALSLVRVHGGDGNHAALAAGIAGELRELESAWVDGDQVYVSLPHAGAAAAAGVLRRLAPSLAPAGQEIEIGLATFPEDGLTLGALRAAVMEPRSATASEPPRDLATDGQSTAPSSRLSRAE